MTWYEADKILFNRVREALESRIRTAKLIRRNGELLCQGLFFVICDDLPIEEEYEVEICFSADYPNRYPVVKVFDPRIPDGPNSDWHIQVDNVACLQLVEQIWIDVGNPSNIEVFFNKTVNDYFIQQTNRILNGKYLSAWDHGVDGRLDFYCKKFSLERRNAYKVLKAIKILMSKELKGSVDCPFCPGKNLRDCHLMNFLNLKMLIRKDLLSAAYDELSWNFSTPLRRKR